MSVQRASLAEDIGLAPVAGKEYKLFLVEVDDEDRERVLSARVGRCEITVEPDYADIHVDSLLNSARIFKTSETVTVTLNLVPSVDGTYFKVENFMEEDEER
jgi:hypothetical protein